MDKIHYVWLTVLCFCLYLPGLASLPVFDRDEPRFAQASREMVESHDYWRINFQDTPRHLKPPGIYWLQASAVRWFSSAKSDAPWPYRLPSAIGAWLAVLLTYGLGKQIVAEKTAALGAVLLASCVLLIIEAHLAVTDAALLATMVAMQWGLGQVYWHYRRGQPVGVAWPLLFWLAMAAGIFIKGITPLVGGLTILGLCLADRELSWLKALRWQCGIPLILLLSAAWLLPFSLASGQNFLWDMIHADALPKLAGDQQSHGHPPGLFTLILTPMFWPGSLFLVPAGIWSWRRRHDIAVRFLLAWILPSWVFFELVHTKLPEYVLPVYPAIALLTASAISSGIQESRHRWLTILMRVQQGFWIICTVALVAALIYLGGWGWIAAVAVMGAAGYLFYINRRPAHSHQIMTGIVITVLALAPVMQWTLPKLPTVRVSQSMADFITRTAGDKISDSNPVLVIDYHEPSLVFLLGTHRVILTNLAWAGAQAQPGTVLLLPQDKLATLGSALSVKHLNWRSLGSIEYSQYNLSQAKQVTFYLVLVSGGGT